MQERRRADGGRLIRTDVDITCGSGQHQGRRGVRQGLGQQAAGRSIGSKDRGIESARQRTRAADRQGVRGRLTENSLAAGQARVLRGRPGGDDGVEFT